ncbi:MAG: M48 family metalloprotease [Magnetococcales bacterium]|nr:M48 family metalloprotease [Magnetococcales bacterium]
MLNRQLSLLLFSALTFVLLLTGQIFGGFDGLLVGLFLGLALSLLLYWFGGSILLTLLGARPLKAREETTLREIVTELARHGGMPVPSIFLIENGAPNALAVGPIPFLGAVAVTRGLLRCLNREELAGVLAHELVHIARRDTLIGSSGALLAGVLTTLAIGPGQTVLWPGAAGLLRRLIDPAREYAADEEGARLCRNPSWLADALEKLADYSQESLPLAQFPTVSSQFIVHPVRDEPLFNLFDLHPEVGERIARLRLLARGEE